MRAPFERRTPATNVLILAAGAGRRFREAGYTVPKPLIDVNGQSMLSRVIQNVLPTGDFRAVAVVPLGFPKFYDVENYELARVTDGAARTALLAIHGMQMDMDAPLLISNSDELIDWDMKDVTPFFEGKDGVVVIFPCPDQSAKWSYAQIKDGLIRRIAEKQPISEWATAGVYWWARTCNFVRAATAMIARDERINGEFYVAPTYNEYIRSGAIIRPYYIKASQFHSLGTPEDLSAYLEQTAKEKV